jgi:hypothetical protein
MILEVSSQHQFCTLSPKVRCSFGLRLSSIAISERTRSEPHEFALAKLLENFLGEVNENLARHQIASFVYAVSAILMQNW